MHKLILEKEKFCNNSNKEICSTGQNQLAETVVAIAIAKAVLLLLFSLNHLCFCTVKNVARVKYCQWLQNSCFYTVEEITPCFFFFLSLSIPVDFSPLVVTVRWVLFIITKVFCGAPDLHCFELVFFSNLQPRQKHQN